VYDGRWEGQHLVIRTEVPDTYSDQTVVLDVHSMLPPMRDNGWRGARGMDARGVLGGRLDAPDADRDVAAQSLSAPSS
jgi:hypothetical protein